MVKIQDSYGRNFMRQLKEINLFLILFIFSVNHCTILEYHNPNNTTKSVLATSEAECNSLSEYRHWSILYGTIPIKFLNKNPTDFLESRSFRIKEKVDAIDFLVSILGGFSATVTSKTVVIENCGEGNGDMPKTGLGKELQTEKQVTTESIPPEKPNTKLIKIGED